ncbi:MAG TPA: hypothetical protein VF444_04815 [Pseudonocardiaceae bacterium]
MSDAPQGVRLLAEAVLERRRQRRLRQRDVEKAGGPSVAVLRNIEHGQRSHPHPKTLVGLDRALSWPAGAARAVLLDDGPPWPGSTVTEPRAYVEELIAGAFSSSPATPTIEDEDDAMDTAGPADLRHVPTSAIMAQVAPWLAELVRRCDTDPDLLIRMTVASR